MTNNDAYNRAMSRTVLRSGCCYAWNGPLTGSGSPRLEVGGRQVDARRIVLEKHGESVPSHARLENRCSTVNCLTYEHVRLRGEDDMIDLACPCGQRIRVLKALHRGAYCTGRPEAPHRSRVMVLVNAERLNASERAA